MVSEREKKARRRWFTVGVAISLSAATFAHPISPKMDTVPKDKSERFVQRKPARINPGLR